MSFTKSAHWKGSEIIVEGKGDEYKIIVGGALVTKKRGSYTIQYSVFGSSGESSYSYNPVSSSVTVCTLIDTPYLHMEIDSIHVYPKY